MGGHRLHRVVLGEGPPLVLLHGFGGWAFAWRHNYAALGRRFRVHALDLLGFGRSAKPRGPIYDLAVQAALVSEYLATFAGGEADLLGHSLGGGVALSVAAQRPERVRRLVLVASIWPGQSFAPDRRLLRLLASPLGPGLLRVLARPRVVARTLRSVYGDPSQVDRATIRGYAEPVRARGAAAALAGLLGSRFLGEALDLSRIAQPALLIWGARDPVVPKAVGDRLAAELPAATLEVWPGVGHVPSEEAPERFNRRVIEFLGG
ncbi:MAG TPA: alpha/beta fold hydrolase [Limnochordia bacterium]|nr:alpha/beta fold hydrolase [Limnochordia bacterium]